MNQDNNYTREFFEQHHLPITFLRQKFEQKKLLMCLGAGFSYPFGLPSWKELVYSISKNPKVNGKSVIDNATLSLTTKVQVLFETYRKQCLDSHGPDNSEFLEDEIRNNWIIIVRDSLYKKYHELDKTKRESDDIYFDEFIELIKEIPITVNYNFDDIIERELDRQRKEDEERIYETTSRPFIQYKRDKGVIYHPNGYIPKKAEDRYPDGDFVFSEKSFQDQLIDTISGRYSPLQYLFLNYTMLITGSSLDDPTLRHMLRKNATLNPGHFHFYIYYTQEKELAPDDKVAIQNSYFETFNLITLFLDGKGIKNLAKFIAMDKRAYSNIVSKFHSFRSYKFYLSGCPGTGKTTALDYLADFYTQNEFLANPNENLFQQDNNLKENERVDLDSWITEQFRLRNAHISDDAAKCCIQLIERSPIDPLCFVDEKKKDALINRAIELKDSYSDEDTKLVNGKIIVLEAKSDIVYTRLKKRNPTEKEDHKYAYSKEYVEKTLRDFEILFPRDRHKYIDTGTNKQRMVKEIAHEVFFGEYKETNLMNKLEEIIKNESKKTMFDLL